jgi:hypothetical protein
MIPFSPRKGAFNCVVCFFHFQRTTGFGYFKEKKEKKEIVLGMSKKSESKNQLVLGISKPSKNLQCS